MTRRRAAPMPAALRRTRAADLTHPCPWCHAPAGTRCTGQRGKTHTNTHPSRTTQWAITTACCPTCQVEPGTPCHEQGRPLNGHHAAREDEARRTIA